MPPGVSPSPNPSLLAGVEGPCPSSPDSRRTDASPVTFSFTYPSPSALFDPEKENESSYAPCSSLFSAASHTHVPVKPGVQFDFDSSSQPSHLSSFAAPSLSFFRSCWRDVPGRKPAEEAQTVPVSSLPETDLFAPLALVASRASGCSSQISANAKVACKNSKGRLRGGADREEATDTAVSPVSGILTAGPKEGSLPAGTRPRDGIAAGETVSLDQERPCSSSRPPLSALSLLFSGQSSRRPRESGESLESVAPVCEAAFTFSSPLSVLPPAATVAGACTLTQGGSAWGCRPSGEDFPLRFIPLLHAEPVRGGVEQAVPLDPGPLSWSSCPFVVDPLAFSLSSTLGDGVICSSLSADPAEALQTSAAALATALKFAAAAALCSPKKRASGAASKGSVSPLHPDGGEREREKELAFFQAFLRETQLRRRRARQARREEETSALMPLGAATAASRKQHDDLYQAFHAAHRVAESWAERLSKDVDFFGSRSARQVSCGESEAHASFAAYKKETTSPAEKREGETLDCDHGSLQASRESGQTAQDGLQVLVEQWGTEIVGRVSDKIPVGNIEQKETRKPSKGLDLECAFPAVKLSCRPSSAARAVLYKALRGVANELTQAEELATHLREKTEPSSSATSSVPSPGAVPEEGDLAETKSSGSSAASYAPPAASDGSGPLSSQAPAFQAGDEESTERESDPLAAGVERGSASSFNFLEEAEEAEEAQVQKLVKRAMLLRSLRDLLREHLSVSLPSGAPLSLSPTKRDPPSGPSSPAAAGPSAPASEDATSDFFSEEKQRHERILSLLLRQVERHEDRQVHELLLSTSTPKPVKQRLVQVLLAEVLAEVSVTFHHERLRKLSPSVGSRKPSHGTLSMPVASERGRACLTSAGAAPASGKPGTQPGVSGGPLAPASSPAGEGVLPAELAGPSPLSILQCLVRAQRAEAATAEVQAEVVAAGRAALLRLAHLAPRLAACIPLLAPYLNHLPRLLHVQLQLLAQQAQRGELTTKGIEEKLLKHFRDQEAFACTPFFAALSQQLAECLAGSRPILPAPSLATVALAPGAATPQTLASGLLAPGAAAGPFFLAQGAGGERGLASVGALAPRLAALGTAREDGKAANTPGGLAGKPPASAAAKKPSRKGMGMSGWALFAKEKRAELQQEGTLEGETLPEQTSFVARFWHQLSKEKKAEWGRRAEELNRQAGLRMKKEEEIRKMKEQAEAEEKKRAAAATVTGLSEAGLGGVPLQGPSGSLPQLKPVLGAPMLHPSLAPFTTAKNTLPGGAYPHPGPDDRAHQSLLPAGTPAGPATRVVHADGSVSFVGHTVSGASPSPAGGLPGDGVSPRAAQAGEEASQASSGFARTPQPQGLATPFAVPGPLARPPQPPDGMQSGVGADFPAAKKKSRSGGSGKKGEGQGKGGRGYTAFTFFAKEMRQKCKEEGIECGTSLSEQNTFIGDKWRQVSPEEKKIFQQRAKEANEAWRREHEEKLLLAQQKEQEQAQKQDTPADPSLAFAVPQAGATPSAGPPQMSAQAAGQLRSSSLPGSVACSLPVYGSPPQTGAYQLATGPGHPTPSQGAQGGYPPQGPALQERRGEREGDAFGATASHLGLPHTVSGPQGRAPPESRGELGAPAPLPALHRGSTPFSGSPSSASLSAHAVAREEDGSRERVSALDSASPPLKKQRGDSEDAPFFSARPGPGDPASAGAGRGSEAGEVHAGERERRGFYAAAPLPSNAHFGETGCPSVGDQDGAQRAEGRGAVGAVATPEPQWRREDDAFAVQSQLPAAQFTPPPASLPALPPRTSPFPCDHTVGLRKPSLSAPPSAPGLGGLAAYPPEEVLYQLKFDSPLDVEEGRRDEDREERGRKMYGGGDRDASDRTDFFVSEQVHSAPLPSRRSLRAAARGALEKGSSEGTGETGKETKGEEGVDASENEESEGDGAANSKEEEERDAETGDEERGARQGLRRDEGRRGRRGDHLTGGSAREEQQQVESPSSGRFGTRVRRGVSDRDGLRFEETERDQDEGDAETEEKDEEWEEEEGADDSSDEDFEPASRRHSASAKKRLRKVPLPAAVEETGETPDPVRASGRAQRRSGGAARESKGAADEETEVPARRNQGSRRKRTGSTERSKARARRRREEGKELLQLSLPASIVEKEGPLTLWDLIQRNKRKPVSSAKGEQEAEAKAKAGASGENGGRDSQRHGELDESFDSVLGSLFSAPASFGQGTLGGGDQALQALLSPSPTRKGRDEEEEGSAEKDLSALFDTPRQGSAPALRLDADGQLVMDERGEEMEPPVCTCGASLGLFDALGQASAPCVCLFNGRRRLVEEGGPGGVNGLSLQPYAGAYKSTKGKRWTPEETQRFYAALEQYGTDLLLVGTLLPHVTDKQLKLKLKIEERRCPEKVEAALRRRRQLTTDAYEGMHGKINAALHYRRALGSSSSDDSDGESETRRPKAIADSPPISEPTLPSAPENSSSSSFPALLSILADASADGQTAADNTDVDPSLFALPVEGDITAGAGDDLLALFG
ncbi:Myb family DNA-binding domain-containing protein [Toxoplasma gondii ME49]|uniref:Myb family DNA-binding domain-containing protein n=1 Tax=Toxoplasma gondii (strain ATCC 50611 / Me49) TaxID=508771 RepID=S8F903_TOXGM|nr:Myb family DNA-binding domain-containing protein [Toxoplasma gondii ME49]EPT30073.1 Myb family DNA-binding domain-containing protein [Toxoplasma gondii ME49]|eukprot:XP_002367677.1 Myb family DNA-binding domain-containing protein [Toxoplasma gondii ME49]